MHCFSESDFFLYFLQIKSLWSLLVKVRWIGSHQMSDSYQKSVPLLSITLIWIFLNYSIVSLKQILKFQSTKTTTLLLQDIYSMHCWLPTHICQLAIVNGNKTNILLHSQVWQSLKLTTKTIICPKSEYFQYHFSRHIELDLNLWIEGVHVWC